MHSDEEIASYLRSISRGGKVNVVLLQQRTEFFYVKYKNQMYATNYSDQEVFEIAVIEAFKEVQLVNSAQHSQDHHAQQPPVLVPDQPHVQLQQAPVHPFLGGDQPHVQLKQCKASPTQPVHTVALVPPVLGGAQPHVQHLQIHPSTKNVQQDSHVHSDQATHMSHHALHQPPSLRVGQQPRVQLQPVLGQFPLQPPLQVGHERDVQALHRPHHVFQLPPSPKVGQQLGGQLQLVFGQLPLQCPVQLQQVGALGHHQAAHTVAALPTVSGQDQHQVQQVGSQGHPQPELKVTALSPICCLQQPYDQLQQGEGQTVPFPNVQVAALQQVNSQVQPLHLPGLLSQLSPSHDGLQGGVQLQLMSGLVSHLPQVQAGLQGGVQPQHMPGLVSHLLPGHDGL